MICASLSSCTGRVIKLFVPGVCLPILPTLAPIDASFVPHVITTVFHGWISPFYPHSCAFSSAKTPHAPTHDAIHTLAICRRCRTAGKAEACSYGQACTADGILPDGVCFESSYQQDGRERTTHISCERAHVVSSCIQYRHDPLQSWLVCMTLHACSELILPLECLEIAGKKKPFPFPSCSCS
jgi:hypothetical protein